MPNGPQTGEESYAAFLAWSTSKSDDDFREYVHCGKLKRVEIATECGFGISAIRQNPAIKSALEKLEAELRAVGVLPPIVESRALGDRPSLPVRDKDAKQRRHDGQRLNALEQENAALRAELGAAKGMLERYRLMSKFLSETGRMPR
jgi:hypothetical protein